LRGCAHWTHEAKNGPAISMMRPAPNLSRRQLLAALSGTAAAAIWRPVLAQTTRPGTAAPIAVAIRQDASGTVVFDPPPPALYRLGDRLRLTLTSELSQRIALGVRGLELREPLFRQPLERGKPVAVDVELNQAGTFVLDTHLVDDGPAKRLPVAAFAVAEAAPPHVDQDRIVLIEDASPGYLVNAQAQFELNVRSNERLRLRLINGCPRNAIALQFDDHDVRIIAIDSRPAEPFLARDRRVVLAPGTRMDALIDAARPAGSTSAVQLFDGTGPKRIGQFVYAKDPPLRAQPLPIATPLADVPIKLELASALRMPIDLSGTNWRRANDLVDKRPEPLFRVKQGRTVQLTLTNRATWPATFHLHGHHFRWLDRLDDGWKPFLLDTMLVDVGQTERIAFRADFSGSWSLECTPLSASEPRRFHWFSVDQR